MRTLCLTAVLLAGCFTPPDDAAEPVPAAPLAEPLPPRPTPAVAADGCDASKLRFTRAQACWNDGWIELCAERSGGTPLVSALRRIAPDIVISEAPMGRVGCDPHAELTAIYRYDRGTACEADQSTMRPEAWATVCQLSALAGTRILVAGFGE